MATMPSSSATSPTARWEPRLWGLLLVLAGNMLIDSLEVSVVLVALPSIGADLGLSLWAVQWTMSGFALGFAAFLLLGPRAIASWGRRRVYLAALVVFAAASVIGGLTDHAAVLMATRVLKGICAALTAPTGLAIITTTFEDGPRQRRAVSLYALFGAAGFTTGLLLSGALTGQSWRWTLLAPAPFALALLLPALKLIPREPARSVVPPFPLLRLLRNGPLIRAALGAATLNGTYLGLLLLVTFQGQHDEQWTPWQTALALLPACLPLALSAPFAARLVGRFGTERLIVLGALTPALGYGLYLNDPVPSPYAVSLLPTLLLVGLGFVLAFAALNMQATSRVAPADRAAAIPIYQTAVQLGAVITLVVIGRLLTSRDDVVAPLTLVTGLSVAGLLIALYGLRADGQSGIGAGETPQRSR